MKAYGNLKNFSKEKIILKFILKKEKIQEQR